MCWIASIKADIKDFICHLRLPPFILGLPKKGKPCGGPWWGQLP